MPALLAESLTRVEEFAPQSLFDVHDALLHFNSMPQTVNPIDECVNRYFEDVVTRIESFASKCGQSLPSSSQATAYQQSMEKAEIVTLGVSHTIAFLRRFGLLCPADDPFIREGRKQILDFRANVARTDPTSRTIFHRAQCAWQLSIRGNHSGGEALADGIFESGEPTAEGHPDNHHLVVCRLRHPREGDAEVRALCAAMGTSVLKGGRCPPGLVLNLHLSDVPCLSCLGATLQFGFRFPGVLRVSFDRGRQLSEDTVPIPRPPPPPSKKGNLMPYAPMPPKDGAQGEAEDRSMIRREGPDCRDNTSFYGGVSQQQRRTNGAATGGMEAVPHKKVMSLQGGPSAQTFYFSAKPDFYGVGDYDESK